MTELTDQQALIACLAAGEGMCDREIAETTGISKQVVHDSFGFIAKKGYDIPVIDGNTAEKRKGGFGPTQLKKRIEELEATMLRCAAKLEEDYNGEPRAVAQHLRMTVNHRMGDLHPMTYDWIWQKHVKERQRRSTPPGPS